VSEWSASAPELEARLRALASDAVWPPTPDLQAAVMARGGAPARPRRRTRRVLAAALAALVLIPAAGAVAFPSARNDVLEWLGLRNVKVERVPAPPPGARPELEDDLGTVVTLAAAQRRAGFKALVPAALGPPDRVRVTGRRVSLIYAPRDDLAKLDEVDAGLILTEVRGGIRGEYLRKLVFGGTDVRSARVDGHQGAFISGGQHAYIYEDPNGVIEEDRTLLAGPTLIWEQGGLVLRMETTAGRRKALQIAATSAR
jgi:hypothetical protein